MKKDDGNKCKLMSSFLYEFSFIIIILSSCNSSHKKQFIIIPLSDLSVQDTIIDKPDTSYIYKTEYYLISGDTVYSKFESILENYACINKAPDLNKYAEYMMYFYRESNITNIELIKKDPQVFFKYSYIEDFVALYKWREGIPFLKENRGQNSVEPQKFNCNK